MSLVNDMLRDLDQRRKDNSNGAAASGLTPASEAVQEAKTRLSLYLAMALAIAAAGVGLAWYFLLNQESEQLNIQPSINPALVDQESIDVPRQPEESPDDADVTDTGAGQEADLVQVTTNTPEITAPSTENQQEAIESVDSEIDEAVPTVVETTDERVEEEPVETTVTDLALTEQPGEENSSINEAPVPDVTIPVGEQGSTVAESIRTEVELTPEQQDMAAVQEALQLIANNRMSDAFGVLDDEIESNRYAHQSRETYAKLLISQGDFPGALRLVNAGLQLASNHPGFKKVKARLLLNESDVDAAVSLLISRAPEVAVDSEYHDILASSQLANRDYQGASVSYTSLVQHDPSQGKWWYGFAASQDRLGNTRAARQAYARAMRQPNLSANLRRRSQERLTQLGP